jgi:hypothetical protein
MWHTTSIVGFVRMLYVTSSSIHLITNENHVLLSKGTRVTKNVKLN